MWCYRRFLVCGERLPILFGFVLDKPSGYEKFCEPETIHYKKKQIRFEYCNILYIKQDSHGEVKFNGETMTFTWSKAELLKELSKI